MHPILYSEIKQWQRDYKTLLFLVVLIVFFRARLGDYGHLINILIVFPSIAGALGVSTLDKEYSKDNLKYLLGMPIKRWHFIFVKLISSFIASGFFLLIIYASKWLIPPRIRLPVMASMAFPMYLNMRFLLMVCFLVAFFQFATGVFFIIFFKSSKVANRLSYLPWVSALIYLLYCFIDTGHKYELADYAFIFVPTSIILAGGAFYLFIISNPFLNKNPRFVIAGILVCVVSIGYFAGSTRVICSRQADEDFVFNKGVEIYSISPDGEFVFVQTCRNGFITHSCVLDSSGAVLEDFGKNSLSWYYSLLWGFNNGKRMMTYAIQKPILSGISRDRYMKFFALDLDSGNHYKFKGSFGSGSRHRSNYKILNSRTMEFMGIGYTDDSRAAGDLCLLKQNILTGGFEKIRLARTEGASVYDAKFIDTESFIIQKELRDRETSDGYESPEKAQIRLNIFDLNGQKVSEILLPEGVRSYEYLPDSKKCYFFEKLTDEQGYSYRVASVAADKIDEVYLAPEDLPRYSFKEAAEGKDFRVTISSSTHKNWVVCRYRDEQGRYHLLLLDGDGNKIHGNIEGGDPAFAPGEERFFVYLNRAQGNGSERKFIQVYDISGRQIVFVKEFEIEDSDRSYRFLDNDTMLYVKDPTPKNEWGNDNYLVRLNLKTMESTPFFER